MKVTVSRPMCSVRVETLTVGVVLEKKGGFISDAGPLNQRSPTTHLQISLFPFALPPPCPFYPCTYEGVL